MQKETVLTLIESRKNPLSLFRRKPSLAGLYSEAVTVWTRVHGSDNPVTPIVAKELASESEQLLGQFSEPDVMPISCAQVDLSNYELSNKLLPLLDGEPNVVVAATFDDNSAYVGISSGNTSLGFTVTSEKTGEGCFNRSLRLTVLNESDEIRVVDASDNVKVIEVFREVLKLTGKIDKNDWKSK